MIRFVFQIYDCILGNDQTLTGYHKVLMSYVPVMCGMHRVRTITEDYFKKVQKDS